MQYLIAGKTFYTMQFRHHILVFYLIQLLNLIKWGTRETHKQTTETVYVQNTKYVNMNIQNSIGQCQEQCDC